MVERVRDAILKAQYYDPEPEMYGSLDEFYASNYPEHVEEAERMARAAIAAMETPTVAMIAAVEAKAEERYRAAPEMQRWYGDEVFVAGVRAALNEGGRDGG